MWSLWSLWMLLGVLVVFLVIGRLVLSLSDRRSPSRPARPPRRAGPPMVTKPADEGAEVPRDAEDLADPGSLGTPIPPAVERHDHARP